MSCFFPNGIASISWKSGSNVSFQDWKQLLGLRRGIAVHLRITFCHTKVIWISVQGFPQSQLNVSLNHVSAFVNKNWDFAKKTLQSTPFRREWIFWRTVCKPKKFMQNQLREMLYCIGFLEIQDSFLMLAWWSFPPWRRQCYTVAFSKSSYRQAECSGRYHAHSYFPLMQGTDDVCLSWFLFGIHTIFAINCKACEKPKVMQAKWGSNPILLKRYDLVGSMRR